MPTTEGEQQGSALEDAEQQDLAQTSSRLHTAELEELVDAALSARERLDLPEPDPYLGLVIDRRYVIESLIAAGGMGLVYRCRHSVLGKRLAIKIIRGDVAQMPDGTDRFLLEAKAASAIGHEHIVDIADFGALPDGSPYLVMEYLDGVSLAALLRDEPELGVGRIASLATQIAEGLGAAHAAGIIHRDLKPDNVFVLERKGDDFIKILDFGVARMAQNAKKLTQAGTIVGTPHYMSPEQALGLEVDHRGDIYALGVILYELLAGRVPFDGSHYVAVLNQHLHALPPPFASLDPPVTIPAALEHIVGRCLAKSPEDRFETMAELSRALAPFREAEKEATADEGLLRASPELPEPSVSAIAQGVLALSPSEVSASASPPRRGAPTAQLPAPSPTLVLPRLSGVFNAQQKRWVTGFSVLVLIGVCAAAAFRLASSRERSAAVRAPSVLAPAAPRAVREPVLPAAPPPSSPATNSEPASAPSAAPSTPPPPAAPRSTSEPPSAAPSTQPPSSADSDARAESKIITKAQRDRERRALPAAKGSDGTRPSPKPHGRDDFINPWPSPR
jgi:serine/threonine protein kinase